MSNTVLAQNVIGRITHGLIGLDLFIQEKRDNEYLHDFLSLTAQELGLALTTASVRRLVPNSHRISFDESAELTTQVLQTQVTVRGIANANQEEIDLAVENLKKAMRLFYELYRR